MCLVGRMRDDIWERVETYGDSENKHLITFPSVHEASATQQEIPKRVKKNGLVNQQLVEQIKPIQTPDFRIEIMRLSSELSSLMKLSTNRFSFEFKRKDHSQFMLRK